MYIGLNYFLNSADGRLAKRASNELRISTRLFGMFFYFEIKDILIVEDCCRIKFNTNENMKFLCFNYLARSKRSLRGLKIDNGKSRLYESQNR